MLNKWCSYRVVTPFDWFVPSDCISFENSTVLGKVTITSLLSTLSILNYVDMDSEAKVLGYGISLIILNLGMYVVVPAIVIVGISKRF